VVDVVGFVLVVAAIEGGSKEVLLLIMGGLEIL
jgi:hypothetical protein